MISNSLMALMSSPISLKPTQPMQVEMASSTIAQPPMTLVSSAAELPELSISGERERNIPHVQ